MYTKAYNFQVTVNSTYVSSMGWGGGGGEAGLGGSTFSSISSFGFRVRCIGFFSFLTRALLRLSSSSSASRRDFRRSASLLGSSFGVRGSGEGGGWTGDWRPSLSLGTLIGSVFCTNKQFCCSWLRKSKEKPISNTTKKRIWHIYFKIWKISNIENLYTQKYNINTKVTILFQNNIHIMYILIASRQNRMLIQNNYPLGTIWCPPSWQLSHNKTDNSMSDQPLEQLSWFYH